MTHFLSITSTTYTPYPSAPVVCFCLTFFLLAWVWWIRYGFLLDNAASQDPLGVSVSILHQFNILPEMYQVGHTKLFFRTGQVILYIMKMMIWIFCWTDGHFKVILRALWLHFRLVCLKILEIVPFMASYVSKVALGVTKLVVPSRSFKEESLLCSHVFHFSLLIFFQP